MSHNHSHHPDLAFTRKLAPILVWSEHDELLKKTIDFIKIEFEEHTNVFTVEEIYTTLSKKDIDEIHIEIEKYNFHVIKVFKDRIELVKIDDQRFSEEFEEDLEEKLELFIRKLISNEC